MISEIEITGFKSLEKTKLRLGHLNLFIGTNASGKSNFFDALRVLQGIAYGFTINEVLNGKPKSATSEVWTGLRGGSAHAAFRTRNVAEPDEAPSFFEAAVISFKVHIADATRSTLEYEIAFSPKSHSVTQESLSENGKPLYSTTETNPDRPYITARINKRVGKGQPPVFEFDRSRCLLHQVHGHQGCPAETRKAIDLCVKALSNSQRIDPSPSILREYSQARIVTRMGERGENFAALINTIIGDEVNTLIGNDDLKSAYLSWLRQLTPTELDDIAVLHGALGEPLFAVKENGISYPAPILSDGTLRFAAITAAFFQPDFPGILTIEEIENGIHPSRLRLLVELLKSQSTQTQQIMATTHSPIVLAWLQESDYDTTFFCKRDEQSGASIILPLSEIPNFLDIARKHPITDLFAEGWLEGAL